MRLTVLIDNVSRDENLVPEWGLAAYIEYEGNRILLDTGASDQFLHNAEQLGIDIAQIDFGVLSHAHYDHADGMPAFFECNKTAPMYLQAGSGENCYIRTAEEERYIGIKRGVLEQYRDRIIYTKGPHEIVPGVMVVPHDTPGLGSIGEKTNMYVLGEGGWSVDEFSHEQSLVLDTERGLFVLNSCSHGGLENIIHEVQRACPGKPICAVFGGLHLYQTPDEEVRALAKRLREQSVEKLYTGHCTGEAALSILKEELGDVVEGFYSGMTIRL